MEWDNEVMKGYILYALNLMDSELCENAEVPKLTEEQKGLLWNGIRWATNDLTLEQAKKYYYEH